MRRTKHQTEQRIQELNTFILLYSIFYYPSTLTYHEITAKSYVLFTIIISRKLQYMITLLTTLTNRFNSQKLKSQRNTNKDT